MPWGGRSQRDFDDEVRSHIAIEADRLVAEGYSRRDAELAAKRTFGNVGVAQERFHDASRRAWLEDLASDIRYAIRRIRLNRAFSANVIAIAALGIFACTATFSVVSGILIQPLPFPNAERVGSIQLANEEISTGSIPIETYRRIEAATDIFEAIAASSPGNAVLTLESEPEQVRYERVTSSFARVYGVSPALGRFFSPAEGIHREPVALLGYDAWIRRFRGDSSIVGRPIAVDGNPITVIGVMPQRFRATRVEEPVLWLPGAVGTSNSGAPITSTNAVARLKAGVSRAEATSWLGSMVTGQVPSFSTRDSLPARGRFVPVSVLILGDVQRPLLVVLGAVGVVLLLVAANIGTLFLVRAAARSGETALRRALGASSWRQVRQSITESAVMTGIGGAIGVSVAFWTVSAIRRLGEGALPRMYDVSLDWRAVAFAVTATMATGILAGLPSFATTAGGTRTVTPIRRLSRALVIAQVTLSVVLLVGAGLLLKGFLRVLPTNPGFTVERRAVLSMRIAGRSAIDATKPENVRAMVHNVTERMRSIEGVEDVASSAYIPFVRIFSLVDVRLSGESAGGSRLNAFTNTVSPNFFSVMNIPVKTGRAFTEADRDGAPPVVMINEMAAKMWWPGQSVIGRQVGFNNSGVPVNATVIGTVADARLSGTDTRARPEMYIPLGQGSPSMLSFIVKTSLPPQQLSHELRRAIWSVAPGLPVETSSSMAELASESVRQARFFTTALTGFAVTAAVLATMGIYAVLAFGVAQRRREIGIRLALGAQRAGVARLVVAQGAAIGAVGVIAGLVGARWLTQVMDSLLLEVTPTDASVFASVACLAFVLSVAAGSVPALRAIHIDPAEALRQGG